MAPERRAASELQARLRSGQFVVTAEITPPVSTDPAEFLRRAMPLKGLATAVNVTDGAADVPLDPPAGWQPKSLQAKIAAGADFVQTQFCMDVEVVRRYVARLDECGVKIPLLIGVAPIPSARSARWMREKLFGTIIPDAHIARLENAADPKREGRNICIEVLRELAEIPGVAGAHVMAPMNFAEIPAVIVESGVAGRKLAHAVH